MFYRTFLQEMPMLADGVNDFNTQLSVLHENLHHSIPVPVTGHSFKIEMGSQITYWVGDDSASDVSLIVDTETIGNFCKVVLSSKNPTIPPNSEPYASALYLVVKEDVKPKHLVFTSDTILSRDGERLWKGLVKRGNTVSVYDTTQQEYILKVVPDENTLSKYIGGYDKMRYVFVLSESMVVARGPITSFALMEIKRKANWALFDHCKS